MSRLLLPVLLSLVAAVAAVEAQQRHWAWEPIRPAAGATTGDGWSRVPLDGLVRARLAAESRRPAAEGEWARRLRRLSFDLTGLPPAGAPTEPPSDRAWEARVDALLGSSAYGEHLARFWLDLARYADSNGYEFDEIRPNAWRYRDYVVRALNADVPYDRFVMEQVAGDELWPESRDAAIATGFNLLGPDMTDAADQAARRQNTLNDMTDTLGLAVLGVTVSCARCHDHKWDPFSMADYYRLQACFSPARFRADIPVGSDAEREDYARRTAEHARQVATLGGRVRGALGGNAVPKNRAEFDRAARALPEPAVVAALKLWQEHQALEAAKPVPLQAIGLGRGTGPAPVARIYQRGDPNSPGEPVEPGAPGVLGGTRFGGEADGSGRRAALARWLFEERNPLTRRVIVNRIWQRLLGKGLVETSSDFGLRGARPADPALLDHLADWFGTPQSRGGAGWSLKALVRRIVLSSTYRQATITEDFPAAAGPSRRRLTAEEVRDAILAVSGRLNPEAGGPGVFPPMPAGAAPGRNAWPVTPDARQHVRRSLYTFVRRNVRHAMLEIFDAPDTNQSCSRRDSSTTAPQALALLNDPEVLLSARHLAGRVAGDIAQAYRVVLNREATPGELQAGKSFVDRQTALLAQRPADRLATPIPGSALPPARGAALTDFCLALINSNEFLYLD